jgi:hypothetical protein
MKKNILFIFIGLAVINFFSNLTAVYSQEKPSTETIVVEEEKTSTSEAGENVDSEDLVPENVIQGEIKEIASDGSYIIVEETRIITTKEFLEDSYLAVGDKVEITVEGISPNLTAVSYSYLFEEPDTADQSQENEIVGEEPPTKISDDAQ